MAPGPARLAPGGFVNNPSSGRVHPGIASQAIGVCGGFRMQ
jgi:hypothetical protein